MPRAKFLSASTFPRLMCNDRSGSGMGKTALSVCYRLAAELLGASDGEEITAASLEWGIENEDNAAWAYEKQTLSRTRPALWKVSPDLQYVGGTMDRLVGENGGLEIKCPANMANHIKHQELMKEYHYQVHGYLWIYELDWIDFVNYDPRFVPPRDLFVTRIERDEGVISTLKVRCEMAYEKALQIAEKIRKEFG